MSHYSTYKPSISLGQKRRRERNKTYVESLMTPCIDCGYFHPAAMDFHHLDPSTKTSGGVSAMSRRGYSLELIKEEIDKCVCLCSNCHRIRHSEEGD